MSLGMELSPGNWSGAIGYIIRDEADMLYSAFNPSTQLFPYVKFGTVFQVFASTTLSGPPRKVYEASIPLTTVMAPKTWVTLVLTWIFISFIATSLQVLQFRMRKKELSVTKTCKFRNILEDNFLGFYGLLFQRGFGKIPPDVGRRILVAGWLILSVVLMTDVSSSFASRLAVNKQPVRIDSLQDILKYPKLFAYIMKGWNDHQLLSSTDDGELKAIFQRTLDNDALLELEDLGDPRLMDDVSSGRAVYLSFRGSLIEILVGIACQDKGDKDLEFYIAKNDFQLMLAAVPYNKNLDPEIGERISKVGLQVVETGAYARAFRECVIPSEPCMKKQVPRIVHKTQNIKGLKQVFVFYGMGMTLSIVVFVLENIFK